MTDVSQRGPLAGLRVLELGQVIAGPFASMMLAWFGADVIKVEPPDGGDPLRTWRTLYKDTAVWWYILARNKRCITADLRSEDGRDLVRRLVPHVDVVLENFKPGRMEEWGLGYDDLRALNPRIVMARVSGWGQSGPYAPRPGYASVAEGVGGLRYVTGFPDRPPARANLSLGDTVAGLHAAIGVLTAIYNRDHGTGEGQVVDIAIYESVVNLMESMAPEYDLFGIVRERQGAKLTGIVPTNTYPCRDGKYIIIGGNGDSIFKRLMTAAGRTDMAQDPRFASNQDRVVHETEIDEALSAWTSQHTFAEVLSALEQAGVPAGPIYSIADQIADPHFQAREVFSRHPLPDGTPALFPNVAPRLSATPGATNWIGPELGAHNDEVYGELLGLSAAEIAGLRARGVI